MCYSVSFSVRAFQVTSPGVIRRVVRSFLQTHLPPGYPAYRSYPDALASLFEPRNSRRVSVLPLRHATPLYLVVGSVLCLAGSLGDDIPFSVKDDDVHNCRQFRNELALFF